MPPLPASSSCHFSKRLLVILVIGLLHSSHRNPVQISGARLRDSPAALARVLIVIDLLDNAQLLERLNGFAVDGAGGIDVVVGARAAVLGAAMHLAEAADTDGLS